MSIIGFVFSIFAIASALCVVFLKNPLYSAFGLVVNLLAVAGLYAIMNAHFLAVSQVVVYAGAIMVLVLFVLMLLNIKDEHERANRMLSYTAAAVCAGVLVLLVVPIVVGSFQWISQANLTENMESSEGSVVALGRELYRRYFIQFELSSLVLLVGIVGACMLAKRNKGS